MEQKILDAVLSMKKQLDEFQNNIEKDLREIKDKLSEHDRKLNTVAGTLEKIFQTLDMIENRIDVLAIDTHENRAEINMLKRIRSN